MASLKEVRNRIVSVNSTQQITKAMKMVAAAKLRRAQDNIMQMRPYAQKLGDMLTTVSSSAESAVDSPLKTVRPVEKVLIVVVTSDRGLCGAFNTNIVKATLLLIEQKYAAQAARGNVEIFAIGKKGAESLAKRGFVVNKTYMDLFGRLNFVAVKQAAEEIMTMSEKDMVKRLIKAGISSNASDYYEILLRYVAKPVLMEEIKRLKQRTSTLSKLVK